MLLKNACLSSWQVKIRWFQVILPSDAVMRPRRFPRTFRAQEIQSGCGPSEASGAPGPIEKLVKLSIGKPCKKPNEDHCNCWMLRFSLQMSTQKSLCSRCRCRSIIYRCTHGASLSAGFTNMDLLMAFAQLDIQSNSLRTTAPQLTALSTLLRCSVSSWPPNIWGLSWGKLT